MRGGDKSAASDRILTRGVHLKGLGSSTLKIKTKTLRDLEGKGVNGAAASLKLAAFGCVWSPANLTANERELKTFLLSLEASILDAISQPSHFLTVRELETRADLSQLTFARFIAS